MSKVGATKGRKVTTDALIEQGNIALSRFEPELALNFFLRAHEMKSDDTNIMDALADIHLQLGNQNDAYQLLLKSTSIAPEVNPHKWLYLAQLQEGCESLSSYEKAAEILNKLIESPDTTLEVIIITKHDI